MSSVKRVWNVKMKVVPLIIDETETISVIQTIRVKWKARNQGTTDNSHVGH
jgi:hypothetical protein